MTRVARSAVKNLIDPRGLGRRRVNQRIPDVLRARRLNPKISRTIGEKLIQDIHGPLLLRRQLSRNSVGDHLREVEMNGDEARRALLRHSRCHVGTPVTALRNVALVTQACHEDGPGSRGPLSVPAAPRRLVGEAKARERRHYDIERILSPSAMCGRVGQRPNNVPEEEYRAWPSMGEDYRQRVRMFRANVDEMNAEAIDLGPILRKPVQRFLAAPPVVVSPPVFNELAQLLERHTLRPVADRLSLRPASLG